MNASQIAQVALEIERQVNQFHVGRKAWSMDAGRWIVYGFERFLGFSSAAELEARVQHAYQSRACIKTAVTEFLKEL